MTNDFCPAQPSGRPSSAKSGKAALLAESLFEGLSAKELDWLAELAESRSFAKGQTLFGQGEEASHLFVVESGRLKIFTTTQSGQENQLGLFGPGTHVAIVALFGFETYPASCEALEDSRVLVLPAQRLAKRLGAEPAMAMAMLKRAGKRLQFLVDSYLELKGLTPIERLSRHLLELAGTDKGPVRIQLPYSRSVLAAAIGIAPENLSRALARLADKGVGSDGGTIVIEDLAKLKPASRKGKP